ncbi:Uncharacterised protein [uncultured archaeon]|nr:Uncharacterised protein [uncultured archaeon]
MLDNIQIDHQLFNEIGIDSENFLKKFEKMKSKERSLAARFDKEIMDFLRKTYPEEIESDELFLRKVIEKNHNLCALLYIITRKIDLFDNEVCKTLYLGVFNRQISSKQQILLDAYTEDADHDLIRKIHYTALLNKGRYITCKTTKELDGVSIKDLTAEKAEEVLRSLFKDRKSKQLINVWYVLDTGEETAFFVFRKAKSRKSIPSSLRKGYDFVEYAKPVMFSLCHGCKDLNIYSGATNQSIKFASSLVANGNASVVDGSPLYEETDKYTEKSKINELLSRIIGSADESLELIEIKFRPKVEFHDAYLTVIKSKDDLKKMLLQLESYFQTNINADIVSAITVRFNNKRFLIYINDESDNECSVCYSPKNRDYIAAKEFTKYLGEKYKIGLNKRSR